MKDVDAQEMVRWASREREDSMLKSFVFSCVHREAARSRSRACALLAWEKEKLEQTDVMETLDQSSKRKTPEAFDVCLSAHAANQHFSSLWEAVDFIL